MTRKYRLLRIRRGEYILPSNDGLTLWRISAYDEDGSASDGDGTVIRGRFWRAEKWRGPKPTPEQLAHALDDEYGEPWKFWDETQHLFPSRADAMQFALNQENREE